MDKSESVGSFPKRCQPIPVVCPRCHRAKSQGARWSALSKVVLTMLQSVKIVEAVGVAHWGQGLDLSIPVSTLKTRKRRLVPQYRLHKQFMFAKHAQIIHCQLLTQQSLLWQCIVKGRKQSGHNRAQNRQMTRPPGGEQGQRCWSSCHFGHVGSRFDETLPAAWLFPFFQPTRKRACGFRTRCSYISKLWTLFLPVPT